MTYNLVQDNPRLSCDAEWGYVPGREDCEPAMLVRCFCVVDGHGREHIFREEDRDRLRKFIAANTSAVWMAWAAQSEMLALRAWGLCVPPHWVDLLVCYRLMRNEIREVSQEGGKAPMLRGGLYDALSYFGHPHQEVERKESLRNLALRRPASEAEWALLTEYCLSDSRAVRLLSKDIPLPASTLYWGHYLQAVTEVQRQGTPFDVLTWSQIQEQAPAVIRALSDSTNAAFRQDGVDDVYQGGHFREHVFQAWVGAQGLAEVWPKTPSGLFRRDHDTLRDMEAVYPAIAPLRQCEDSRRNLGKRVLAVDRSTGKHHHPIWPFSSTTGRNQPTGWLPGMPRWMRFLAQAHPGHALIYADFTAQEFAIAAALSGDVNMKACYEHAGDPYINFGIHAGFCPSGTSKQDPVRARLKTVCLAQMYGQKAPGVALRLGVPLREAEDLVAAHKRLFPRFHAWRTDWVDHAVLSGQMHTRLGWRCAVSCDRPSAMMNWPVQAGGAEILRLATIALVRAGHPPCDLIHDAVLLHVPDSDVTATCEAIDTAFRFANNTYMPEVILRWKTEVYRHPLRWGEGSGGTDEEQWNRIRGIVQ